MSHFIGLMSGTSLDGVDAVLALDSGTAALSPSGHVHLPFPEALRAELLALNSPGADEIHRSSLAANALARLYAQAVADLLVTTGVPPAQVRALGAHGQTVRHRPGEFDGQGYTVQLLNPALLAECCGIDVVCDFRSRDVAAGGQGAPLVPAFHAAVLARPGEAVAVLNLGGIANLTLLPADGLVSGFDCGPGNLLLDLWCARHRGTAFDAAGAWAASGRVLPALLQRCLEEPFLMRSPPKSTGRDLFNAPWLQRRLDSAASDALPMAAVDVMCTLTEFTAAAAVQALERHAPRTRCLVVCGGGAHNSHLLGRLRARLAPSCRVDTSEAAGIPPDQVEALAFAWLAREFVARRPGNLAAVTGARGSRLLGALYPAG